MIAIGGGGGICDYIVLRINVCIAKDIEIVIESVVSKPKPWCYREHNGYSCT